jgi:hypothetical protein
VKRKNVKKCMGSKKWKSGDESSEDMHMRRNGRDEEAKVEGHEEAVDELAPPIVMGGMGEWGESASFMKNSNCRAMACRAQQHAGEGTVKSARLFSA